MKRIILLIILLAVEGCILKDRSQLDLIPLPARMELKNENFILRTDTKLVADDSAAQIAEFFNKIIEPATGYQLTISASAKQPDTVNSIRFIIDPQQAVTGEEGYTLSVSEYNIIIKAMKPAGLFYGMQTLRQLLPAEIESAEPIADVEWEIPCVEIQDQPRYRWRGMHLDVCRHFLPVEFVKKYIDLLAMHKFNKFHWHLTEDQGWRIEIKKYPKLSEISAWRNETLIGHSHEPEQKFDGIRHGGFYTQDEIKDVVAYAAERFVEVIPEIEMPGHSVAALAAYPELSCTGGPFEVRTYWGISDDVYCAGKEATFQFLENVLNEVIELFPSKYIHIGGDECPKVRWKECPDCQQRIKDEKLQDEHELQSYFIRRIEKFLIARERKLIGWDEILEGGLAPEATVMSWRGMDGGIAAAQQNHDVIMTPTSHCYFDYYQANPDSEPLAIGGFLPLRKVYSLEPTPDTLSQVQAKHILGAQGNVWTEYMKTPEHVEYMIMPRMLALADVVWSPQELRDFDLFLKRVQNYRQRLERLDLNYSRSAIEEAVSKTDTRPEKE